MKLSLIFFMLNVLSACNGDRAVHDFTITKYHKVDEGYQYSKDLLKYKGNTYKPVVSSDYINDTLTAIAVYKSEGKISYSKEELRSDPLFMKTLNLPEVRKVEIKGESLIESNNTYPIDKKEGDSIICIVKDTLFLYNIH